MRAVPPRCRNGPVTPPGDRCTITWLGHATVLIELDGMRLLTDPVLRRRIGPLVRIAPSLPPPDGVDAVLISHLHADHLDPPSLKSLAGSPAILAPAGSAAWLRRAGLDDVRELRPHESLALGTVTVHAVPAVHDERRYPWGPRAAPVGYLITGSRSVYFAGDTDLFTEMAGLRGRAEVALLPVWGWGPSVGAGHLDPERAGAVAAMIEPRLAIPIHWGTYALPWAALRRDGDDRPARQFAELMRQRVPRAEVRLLAPGASTDV